MSETQDGLQALAQRFRDYADDAGGRFSDRPLACDYDQLTADCVEAADALERLRVEQSGTFSEAAVRELMLQALDIGWKRHRDGSHEESIADVIDRLLQESKPATMEER